MVKGTQDNASWAVSKTRLSLREGSPRVVNNSNGFEGICAKHELSMFLWRSTGYYLRKAFSLRTNYNKTMATVTLES